jgi:RNA polymerase sigma-70 factor, ECF subfamily
MVTRGERSLIERAAGGDAQAFTELVGRYDRVVRSAAYNVVLDRILVDDVVQDAYIKVFRSLGQYRGESAFSTWLHRIAARTAIDHLRRRRVQQPLDGIDPPASQLGPEDRTVVDDQVGRALAALTADQRAAVVLVDQLGMSYDDAADVLDVQPGTVASRVSRARARTREVLEPSGTDEEGGAR